MSNAIKKLVIPRDPVPVEHWGKDHWGTLIYIETRCVDYDGKPNNDHMRTDPDRHPAMGQRQNVDRKYPTILKDGVELQDHDDWDCVDDMKKLGLLKKKGSAIHPRYELTDLGRSVVSRLRIHKQKGGSNSNFEIGTL